MAGRTLPMAGGCRCGAVRFRIDAPPMIASVCHCRGCQRMTGSAFSATLTVPADGFAVTAGETVIGGCHGADAHHQHCDACKSWLFTTVDPALGFVNVRATMLDDAGWFVPYMEVQTAERLSWVQVPAVRSYQRFPPMEDYSRLIADYADWAGR